LKSVGAPEPLDACYGLKFSIRQRQRFQPLSAIPAHLPSVAESVTSRVETYQMQIASDMMDCKLRKLEINGMITIKGDASWQTTYNR
jgi:hypothetical protein